MEPRIAMADIAREDGRERPKGLAEAGVDIDAGDLPVKGDEARVAFAGHLRRAG